MRPKKQPTRRTTKSKPANGAARERADAELVDAIAHGLAMADEAIAEIEDRARRERRPIARGGLVDLAAVISATHWLWRDIRFTGATTAAERTERERGARASIAKAAAWARPYLNAARRKGGDYTFPGIGAPSADRADLRRRIERAALVAFSDGRLEVDADLTAQVEQVPEPARAAWLNRHAWNNAEVRAIAIAVVRVLEEDGHLLGRPPRTGDMVEHVRSAIEAQRDRTEHAVENYVAAVLRGYGLTPKAAKDAARDTARS